MEYKHKCVGNRIVYEGEVVVQDIKDKFDREGIEYTWCFEKGKVVFTIQR